MGTSSSAGAHQRGVLRVAGAALLAPIAMIRTLAAHSFLLRQLAWRAFLSRHAGNYLGWLWTPVSTVVQFVLYVVVFSAILEIKITGLGIDIARRPPVGFGVYLMTGLVPFLALNDAVSRAARVFRAHVSLVQRVRFPAEVLVVGDAAGAVLHHVLSLLVVLAYCAVRRHLAVGGLGWVCCGLALCAVWILGLSLLASVLGALFPDISEGLTLLLQVTFYGAPIIYPLALIENPVLRMMVELNPITQLVGVLRAGMIGAAPPSLSLVFYVAGTGLILCVAGAAALELSRARIPDLL